MKSFPGFRILIIISISEAYFRLQRQSCRLYTIIEWSYISF